MSDENLPAVADETDVGWIAKASDLAFDAFTGTSIPAPVRRNFMKVAGRLLTAAVDIPVAYLEGKAIEKRAETEARVKLISTAGAEIAKQVEVPPEYAQAAVRRYGEKIVRERINIDTVVEKAAKQIEESSARNPTIKEQENQVALDENLVSDDWINTFEDIVGPKSSEEMQDIFARILAGEIQEPQSFSIRTLKVLDNSDKKVATLFSRFCSLTISMRIRQASLILDGRVLSLGGSPGANALQAYGLNFDQLNILQEYGLIISDYNSYYDYNAAMVFENNTVSIPFSYLNNIYCFALNSEKQNLRFHGVALSKAGKELLPIVELKEFRS